MNENDSQLHATLGDLGFSAIETKIYVFLLRESPATGYRISHGIGKPTANTYKAITALQEKGALLIDEGEKRLVRAVPPRELLARLERGFSKQCAEAEEMLSSLEEAKPDSRVWQLSSVPQVYERARSILAAAKEIVLADVFPDQLSELLDDFNAAADRGVRIYVITYAPVANARFKTVSRPSDLEHMAWPGDQLNIVSDASEHLLSMFSRSTGAVHQAIWSNSPYLSCLQHNNLSMEVAIKSLPEAEQNKVFDRKVVGDIFLSEARPPGLEHMIRSVSSPDMKDKVRNKYHEKVLD